MNKTLKSRYKHIKERCYNPNSKSYARYGGRGIRMCNEWLADCSAFETWCIANGFQEGLAIDRIDNDGDYGPDNCRFVTLRENNQNRRTSKFYTIGGVTKNLQQWCDTYGLNRTTVHDRIERGMSIEEALTTPVKPHGKDKTSLVGRRFGRLCVIRFDSEKPSGGILKSMWLCKCDCGNDTVVDRCKLVTGHTKSCGCLVSEKARRRMLTDNPMKTPEQRRRMSINNPAKKRKD